MQSILQLGIIFSKGSDLFVRHIWGSSQMALGEDGAVVPGRKVAGVFPWAAQEGSQLIL